MKFRFAARVIAQLGAELISSDDIAVYELIKNALDAGSPRVRVDIRYVAAVEEVAAVKAAIRATFKAREETADVIAQAKFIGDVRDSIRQQVEALRPVAPELAADLRVSKDRVLDGLSATERGDRFITLVGSLNGITISDTGSGMDEGTLQDCFLTIGTTNRMRQIEAINDAQGEDEAARPPSGEKGIGRLSAMRLGNDLQVRTWTASGTQTNVLVIDWRVFSPDSPLEAQEIEMEVRKEPRAVGVSGTEIVITDLQSSWDEHKTKDVAARFLTRFLNPFEPTPVQPVDIVWNGKPVVIPFLPKRYLEASHNGMKGKVTLDADGRFTLVIDYWFRHGEGERNEYTRTYSSADFGRLTDAQVAEVGPFTFDLYHYNRPRITAIPGYATRVDFRKWLDEWAGGLMLYRNGLRVMPYGRMPDDDWLELDKHALRGRGFRVNRIQVVGCVRISRLKNPLLQDQTNREGLRDNTPANTFRTFLQRIIQELFVDQLNQQTQAAGKSVEDLRTRSADIQRAVEDAVDRLTTAASETDARAVDHAARELRTVLGDVPKFTDDLQEAVNAHAIQRIEVLELAATGMTAMSLAHDLEAAIDTAMAESGALAKQRGLDAGLRSSLEHLVALFKSLRTLVADIKPGPAKTRRRKSTFDVVAMSEQLGVFYQAALERGSVHLVTAVQPPHRPFRVKAVEGHVRQVLDNMFRNSVYWLADTQEKHRGDAEPPRIHLMFDLRSKTLTFSDTGVGIAQHDREWIFDPFTTHRQGGFGLGLYISRELCKFNGIGIRIDPDSTNKWRRHDKIVLDFSECFVEGEK